ncbi:hypothetical protein, partial [Leeia oryzae]|uniref:hypothetical protein n=1 Tax=Leeia oryzae TaxID=356662 RepID=UPI001B7FC34B
SIFKTGLRTLKKISFLDCVSTYFFADPKVFVRNKHSHLSVVRLLKSSCNQLQTFVNSAINRFVSSSASAAEVRTIRTSASIVNTSLQVFSPTTQPNQQKYWQVFVFK